jgi:hypothetical protein
MRPLVAHCHLGLGKLYGRMGKREEAQEHLTTATTMYREMGMTYWLERDSVAVRELNCDRLNTRARFQRLHLKHEAPRKESRGISTFD